MEAIIKSFERAGICREWLKAMRRYPTVEAFCDLFFRGSDFAIRHDLPQRDHIYENREEAEAGGIFIDAAGRFDNAPRLAFFGKSEPQIFVSGHEVAEIYLRDMTVARLTIKDHAFVVLNILDKSSATVEMGENAICQVYRYHDSATVNGEVTSLKERELK